MNVNFFANTDSVIPRLVVQVLVLQGLPIDSCVDIDCSLFGAVFTTTFIAALGKYVVSKD